ncbi:MAG TPA: oligosaccharide flippase family protein [Steroidobacteraceae bacterium]
MRDERRILFNTTILSASEGLGQLANLVLIVSFARAFGARTMGYYSVGMSVGAIAALFVSMGIPSLLIREISRDPACARDRLGVLLPVQLLWTPIAWALGCAVSVALIGTTGAMAVVMAACGYQILLPVTTLLLVPLQARELMLVSSACNLAHRLLILVLGLGAIWLHADAGTVALAFIAGALALAVMGWRQTARRFGAPAWRFRPAEALQLYRAAAPFFGVLALSVIYARGATLMLSGLSTTESVGLYAVADRAMVALGLGAVMFNSAVYPALARVAHHSPAEARALLARCLRLLLVAAIPLAALASIFSFDLVHLCFGAPYQAAARALQVLAWTVPIRGAQSLFGSQLAALNQQVALARTRFIGLALFLTLSPVLIIYMGYVGAAWAVLCCDSLQLSLYWRLLGKERAAPELTAAYLAPAAAAATSALISLLLADRDLAVRLAAAVAAMAAGLWGFGAIKLHDLRFLRTLISGKSDAKAAELP